MHGFIKLLDTRRLQVHQLLIARIVREILKQINMFVTLMENFCDNYRPIFNKILSVWSNFKNGFKLAYLLFIFKASELLKHTIRFPKLQLYYYLYMLTGCRYVLSFYWFVYNLFFSVQIWRGEVFNIYLCKPQRNIIWPIQTQIISGRKTEQNFKVCLF